MIKQYGTFGRMRIGTETKVKGKDKVVPVLNKLSITP
jgi:hypothetical protein